jgi:hypothetical protein
MKPKVYVETTIISYLAARPSRDRIVAGHQQITMSGGKRPATTLHWSARNSSCAKQPRVIPKPPKRAWHC